MKAKKIVTIDEALEEIDALKIAFLREQRSREKAEQILEEKTSNLFKLNENLHQQYVNTTKAHQEIDYLLSVTKLEDDGEGDNVSIIKRFLRISSSHLWSEASFAFLCDKENSKIKPVTSHLLSSNQLSSSGDEEFKRECFDFLEIHLDSSSPLRYSKFSQEMRKINISYAHLNHSYLCPLEVDTDEKYLIWFTFSNAIELDEMTIELVDRGIGQLKSTLQKRKSKMLLFENYKKLKEMKSQLIQSEKMASIGTISAGIAHEINNPLSFLLTNSEVLKDYMGSIIGYIEKLENGFDEEDKRDKIKENINYIINGLRVFSRADDGEIKDFDINTCIESSLRLVSNELKHKCRVGKHLESKQLIKGSEGQIIQVITNLLVNSAQAIEEYGVVEVKTRDEGSNVIITIKDNGKGISKENLNNLFTPFFTTKPVGQGTGLGLSISYGIVKRHKGSIQVDSSVGIGTVFEITLPSALEKTI